MSILINRELDKAVASEHPTILAIPGAVRGVNAQTSTNLRCDWSDIQVGVSNASANFNWRA
jgi:hypothetical protein